MKNSSFINLKWQGWLTQNGRTDNGQDWLVKNSSFINPKWEGRKWAGLGTSKEWHKVPKEQ